MTIVCLWTTPCSISTAFERAILELDSIQVFHEPYTASYYFSTDHVSTRYSEAERNKESALGYVDTAHNIQSVNGHVFIKDMAYAIYRGTRRIKEVPLSTYRHSILIRTPTRAVPSLYRKSHDTERTGWSYFDEMEVGYRQLWMLFKELDASGQRPYVVLVEDLLRSPESVLQQYCHEMGLPYKKGMSRWKPGLQPGWNLWPGWHDTVIQSSGIEPAREQATTVLIPEIEESLEEAMGYYERFCEIASGQSTVSDEEAKKCG